MNNSEQEILKRLEKENKQGDGWKFDPTYITKVNDDTIRIKFCNVRDEYGTEQKAIKMEVEQQNYNNDMLVDKAIKLGTISLTKEGQLEIVTTEDLDFIGGDKEEEAYRILDSVSEKIVGCSGEKYHDFVWPTAKGEPQLQERFEILHDMLETDKLKYNSSENSYITKRKRTSTKLKELEERREQFTSTDNAYDDKSWYD